MSAIRTRSAGTCRLNGFGVGDHAFADRAFSDVGPIKALAWQLDRTDPVVPRVNGNAVIRRKRRELAETEGLFLRAPSTRAFDIPHKAVRRKGEESGTIRASEEGEWR